MASTIQQIETPKRARALDTSSGWQAVSPELFTTADATSIVNEAGSSVHAWTAMAGAQSATITIVGSGEQYHGDYALKYTPAADPNGNGDGVHLDLNTYCTIGKTYEISIWGRHAGDGVAVDGVDQPNNHYIRMSSGSDLGAATAGTVNLTNPQTGRDVFTRDVATDEVWSERFIRFTHSANTRYLGARESGTCNCGSLILDALSIKEVRNFPNNNHGQLYSGRALEFDGVTDYLDIGQTTFVDFSEETTQANKAWTVAAWINVDSLAAGRTQNIIGEDISASAGYISVSSSGSYIQIWDIGGAAWRQNNTKLQASTWYRAAWVFDGDTTVTFYLNGVADGTGEIDNTGNNADLITRYIGIRKPDGSDAAARREFGGKMADLQLWQGAWTADDASYDYLNPESLALNRGGTSLTNSNLKLWYPMQDGFRGNQSYILDASNAGLGDNILVNPTFDTSINIGTAGSGWQDQIVVWIMVII